AGIKWAVELLREQRVFESTRLPSVAVLPVLAALHEVAPATLDGHGNARTLSKAYLWRAFLTNRYEQAAASRALQDFRGIRDAFKSGTSLEDCRAPIFDEEQTPLSTVEELIRAGWPRRRETLGSGVCSSSK